MQITFLGTGTSQGVPVIACSCEVCLSKNKKDKRLRSSVFIEVDGNNFVIDTTPDFRQQILRENKIKLDAILYTHEHKDHTAGLDDVRAFNFSQKKAMDIYAEERVQKSLKNEFIYAFEKKNYPGVPKLDFHLLENKSFFINGTRILPIRASHFKLPVFAFRIKNFTYITDVNFISQQERDKIKGTKILVINALRKEKHISHFNLNEALRLIKYIRPERAYLTHISHAMGFYDEVSKELPENVFLAFDGLTIIIND